MGKRIACVITDMFEDSEYNEPKKAFVEAGHEVVTVGFEKDKKVKGAKGKIEAVIDISIDDAEPEDFDALFIPGGYSPDQLRGDARFVDFAKQFMSSDKPVFAICHGPQLLITAKALEGRDVTGFKSIQVDLDYAKANVHDKEVIVCHNQLVTSRQPEDIPAFNRESLKLLAS